MQNIVAALRAIERERDVRILYACETGSRAWGFPSPDSDYDVRFIYVHEMDHYLKLNEWKDSIEVSMEGDLDMSGWDLRKSLVLLKKSNAALIERFNSPIEYMAVDGFREKFSHLINCSYSPVTVFWHHYSLASKFWEELKDKEQVKLKSLFYLIRSLLSCNWIVIDDAVVPMQIDRLMSKVDVDIKDRLNELIKFKATVGEKYLHPADKVINEWIVETFKKIEVSKNNLKSNNSGYELLNEFFKDTLNNGTYHT